MIRRDWLAGTAAAALAAGCRARTADPLAALVDAVLPAGHGLPGAIEVGVMTYLERTLAEPRFAGVARLLRDGARELERTHGPLGERSLSERLQALAAAPPVFTAALVDFTLEGYLGHPAHGGNRDGRVWAALAVPIPT